MGSTRSRAYVVATLVAFTTSLASAQPTNPVSVFPSAGSQFNSPTGAMLITATYASPSQGTTTAAVLSATSFSTTMTVTNDGTILPSGSGTFSANVTLLGTPNAPIAMAFSTEANAIVCGGIANAPCATGPYLPSTITTSAGNFHLGVNSQTPTLIFDGLGLGLNAAPPAFFSPAGSLSFSGSFPFGLGSSGFPRHYFFQALVADPTSPVGLRFTAAMTLAQWIFYV